MSSASLTTIPTDVCNYCFEFLEDKDLRSARWTSSLFLKAFCSRYQGSATPTVGQCWSYIILCQLGFKFANVTHLNVQLPYESLLFRFITMANFPRVTSMILNYVHLGCMPVNSNVRFLTMVGCTFTGKRPRKKERLFPFFNVQDLRIESGSALSPMCGLPKLQQLRRIVINDTKFTHPITSKRFPRLAHVELRGSETLENFPNFRCPMVQTLTLSHPELFPVRRDNQFFFIRHLKLFLTSEFFDLVPIMNRLDGFFFPRIETLELDFGVRRFDCDLMFLYPLPTLKTLRINMLGYIDVSSLTDMRFPTLRIIILNGDFVDLDDLPAHSTLRMIMFPLGTNSSRLSDQSDNWPRLTRFGSFSYDLDLTLSDTDDECPDEPTVLDEEMRILNNRVEELAEAFDEREEKLREERLQAEMMTQMDMEDEIKGS